VHKEKPHLVCNVFATHEYFHCIGKHLDIFQSPPDAVQAGHRRS
jgi:hypothetical protein